MRQRLLNSTAYEYLGRIRKHTLGQECRILVLTTLMQDKSAMAVRENRTVGEICLRGDMLADTRHVIVRYSRFESYHKH